MTRDRWIMLVAAVILAAVLVPRATRSQGGSMRRTWLFADKVAHGVDPYTVDDPRNLHVPYPPSYGIIMAPLSVLPLAAARALWAVLQVIALAGLVVLCLSWFRSMSGGPAPPLWLVAGAFALVARYLWRDTAGGGGNLVFGALVAMACLRPGEAPGEDRHPWRGALLGIVLAAKPTPVLFLGWLWLRGRHRSFAVAIATAVALHMSPMLTLGAESWWAVETRWIEGVWRFATQPDLFADPALSFPRFSWMHQSLRYCLARYCGTVPDEFVLVNPLFFQGIGMGTAAIGGIRLLASVLLVGVTAMLLWRRRRATSAWVEIGGVAAIICLTLLLSPITWKSYHVQLFPAFFAMLALRRRSVSVGLALYFVACVALAPWLIGRQGKEVLQSLYVVTFGALWVWVVCLRATSAPLGEQQAAVGLGEQTKVAAAPE